MKKRSLTPLIDFREVDELILKVLSRSRFGLSADRIRRDLPPSHRLSKDQINSRLKDLLAERKIYVWNPPRGMSKKPSAPICSLEPLESLINQEVHYLLKNQPLTPAEIKKKFPAHINKHLLNFLEPLIKRGMVKWHPPLKGKRLGLEEPNPAEFLLAEIKKLFAKGEKLGFSVEAILRDVQGYIQPLPSQKPVSMSSEEAEKIIFKAMTALKPAAAQGALVYIPDLRKALREIFPGKESFDQAVLDLAAHEKVQLQSHSLPAELTEEQRQAMIDNQRGSYFMAIGIRME